MHTIARKSPSPHLLLSVSKQHRISILESQNAGRVCFKTQGHFLTQKESAFQILVDSEQLEKAKYIHTPVLNGAFNCNLD